MTTKARLQTNNKGIDFRAKRPMRFIFACITLLTMVLNKPTAKSAV